MKYHPDKVSDESKKDESNLKFQLLAKIYSILSDSEKKKLYDESGIIDGEDTGGDERDWTEYCKNLFKKVTKEDMVNFFDEYRNSDKEKSDLLAAYEKNKGDMDNILEEMFSENIIEDEPRFKKILLDAIEKKEVSKFEKFTNESKKKADKRKAYYEQEAREAEDMKKEMGIDESEESLKKAIMSRRQEQTTSFLDQLANKYGKTNKKEKVITFEGKKTNAKSNGTKMKNKENEDTDENEEIDDEDDDEDDDTEGDESIEEQPKKKTASSFKTKTTATSKRKSSNKTALKKRVKRL